MKRSGGSVLDLLKKHAKKELPCTSTNAECNFVDVSNFPEVIDTKRVSKIIRNYGTGNEWLQVFKCGLYCTACKIENEAH